MIASESELGLSEEHEGIMVLQGAPKPGTRFGDLFDVEDVLFEIDNKSLTHRPDCWGHRGIAREVAALVGRPLLPMNLEVPYTETQPLNIQIDAPEACSRYLAVTMDGVQIAPSPFWLRILLHRVGIRSINNAVDATNFVMLDLGNPLHAFDARQINGDQISVRWASEGEGFTTLDETERTLKTSDLLIADGERGVALAGIMGGLNSEIQDETTAIVLEAASFNSSTIRMTSSRLGLRTDSSARFEKSLDPNLAEDASRAFCVLLAELCPTLRITSALMDAFPGPIESPVIELNLDLVNRRLGKDIGHETIVNYLSRLGFGVDDQGEHLIVTVPTWRATKDISIGADLIEEVGRSYGYDNIEPQPPAVTLSKPHPNKQKYFERAARSYLTQAGGLDEVLTYSFDSDPLLEKIDAMPENRVLLRNAISAEMPAMRTSLGPNLLGALLKNERREDRIRLFEIGRVFRPSEGTDTLPHQPTTLGAIIGQKGAKGIETIGLFPVMKGLVLGLGKALSRELPRLVQGGVEVPWVHPIRQAQVFVGDACIGYIAEAHPRTLHQLDVQHGVAMMELDLEAWRAQTERPNDYTPLAKFPAVFRDFAVVVDESVRAGAVQAAIQSVDAVLIKDVEFQSAFRSEDLGQDRKCLAWSITIQHRDRTLQDTEIRGLEEQIWATLADTMGGVQRT
jgi:phenylalanyl-tRNA synthetase beta chain